VFAAQHYVSQLVLPASKRRGSVLPRSGKDNARKAFERLAKPVLPASHVELQRALEREARAHDKRLQQLAAAESDPEPHVDRDPDAPLAEADAED
jgi:hypothetical protein